MTELLCLKCNLEIFEDKNKLYNYLTTFQKEDDKNIYKKIIIDNIDLDNIDEILNNYIDNHNKKFDFYFVKCLFKISFDNDIYEFDTIFVYNKECYKIIIQLIFFINIMKSQSKIFNNINKMTIIIHSDICNMTDEYSRYMRLNPIERQINIIFSKNPQLLNQISNNILIRNKSHIIFNIQIMNSFHEIKYNNYLSSLVKNDSKFLYMRYIINKVNNNNFEKIFNDYITNHNKKLDFYYINCEFQIATNNQFSS